ncbi:hypothetical protein HDE_03927 [Halotydeus destructor]|nr:hypothetical protein HDE_03927 [Halotydeus destructor]
MMIAFWKLVTVCPLLLILVNSVSASFPPGGPTCTVTSLIPGTPMPTTSSMSGSCQSVITCRGLGGVPIGKCGLANVCCVFPRTCDSRSNQNQTYFTNPAYPSPFNGTLSCSLTIHRIPSPYRMCQIRLDFVDFEINSPLEGECSTDRFVVSGQNSNSIVPPICGRNTGQHMYFDIEGAQGPFTLRVITSGPGIRRWNIQISQIECANPSRAPSNCLQYFTGPSGQFSSFNYELAQNQDAALLQNLQQANPQIPRYAMYFNSMDYTICFRKESGFCTQTYYVNTTFVPMEIDSRAIGAGVGTQGDSARFGLTGFARCQYDYILLDGIRFCGARLTMLGFSGQADVDSPVIDRGSGPFNARFVSNERHVGRGFRFNFQQNPCGARIPAIPDVANTG